MTKFLNQKCSLEIAAYDDNGEVQLNKFGEVIYQKPVIVKCRRESIIKDIQVNNGAILKSYTRYFLDNSVSIKADDRLDGNIVLEVESYTNAAGLIEGYEVYA